MRVLHAASSGRRRGGYYLVLGIKADLPLDDSRPLRFAARRYRFSVELADKHRTPNPEPRRQRRDTRKNEESTNFVYVYESTIVVLS